MSTGGFCSNKAGKGIEVDNWPFWVKVILIAIICKLLFGSAIPVQVHDTYTLEWQTVDSVPYGVAVTGSVLSNLDMHLITLRTIYSALKDNLASEVPRH